jgi:hypothetical protein
MLAAGRRHKDREWAVEGCNGIGRHVAQRLVADGETVVDVPAKLSARARVFTTGQGRKPDPVDARSVAVVALRTTGLRRVQADDTTVALRLLVDRRDQLGRARTELVNRLHTLLLELIAGGAKKDLSAQQTRALLATVRPRDVAGKTRRWLTSELIHELVVIDKKIKVAKPHPDSELNVGFEGEGIAVGVLEPSDTPAAGASGDPLRVVVELLVAGELDAGRNELVNDLVDVVDVPRRQCRRGLPGSDRLVHVQGWPATRTVDAAAIGDAGARARTQHR